MVCWFMVDWILRVLDGTGAFQAPDVSVKPLVLAADRELAVTNHQASLGPVGDRQPLGHKTSKPRWDAFDTRCGLFWLRVCDR